MLQLLPDSFSCVTSLKQLITNDGFMKRLNEFSTDESYCYSSQEDVSFEHPMNHGSIDTESIG